MRFRALALSLALPCSSLALAACGGGVSEISTPPAAAEPAPTASAASASAPSPSSSARPKTQAEALAELGKLEGSAILGVLGQSQDVGQAFGAGGLGLRGVGEGGGGRGEGIGLGGIGGLGHGSGASGKGRGVWRGYGGGYPRARSRVETSKAEGPLTLGVIDRVVYLNGSLFSSCHAKARSATGKATFTLRISGDGSVLAVERGAIDVKSDLVVDCAERVAKGLLFPRAGGDKTSTTTIVIRF